MRTTITDFCRRNERQIILGLFLLFLAVGIFARVWRFGTVPDGINQDEAFAGYEAYSLLHYGKDSSGYAFPVYLTAWGSGMNALNSYLMIPFIALFGLETWVVRLPQLLVALASLPVAYLLLREITDERAALCGLFLTAIAPWHILLARWGLESNLAPGFLLFGLYCFVRGVKQPKWFLLSALMYGLSLYCYATLWPFVPLILLLQVGYCLLYHKIHLQKETVLSAALLFLLALPLLLFLLVNMGLMEEIRLPFLSIPKLVFMRSDEISFSQIPQNLRNLWTIVRTQSDGLIWNSTERFGLLYFCTLPFFFLGLFYYLRRIAAGFRQREFRLDIFLLIQLFAAGLLGLLIHVNINRVNCLWFPMIFISATGVWYLCRLVGLKFLVIPFALYAVLFVRFERFYFTDYAQELAYWFRAGLEDAMEEALSHSGTIYIASIDRYARVLFYSKENVNEYIDTVRYTNYPDAILEVESFGRFCFDFDVQTPDPDGVYVLRTDVDDTALTAAGFTEKNFGMYTVAYLE